MEPRKPVIASILDRLIDERPDQKIELTAYEPKIDDLRRSVRRDLENLLNARIGVFSLPSHLREIHKSVVAYGIPDISGADLGTARKQAEFLKTVQTAIEKFEPRFKSVRVQSVKADDSIDRTLRFRIDAIMYADPMPESVVFDSAFDPSDGRFRVKGA